MFVMERSKILKEFVGFGYQLTNDALGMLSKNPLIAEQFLKSVDKKTVPATIDVAFINNFLNKDPLGKESLTPSDYTNMFVRRLDIIKNIFSEKKDLTNLISINKISPRTNKFSIIGMVKEKDENGKTILLEDQTGETTVQIEDQSVLKEIIEDEVLGAVCENTDSGVVGNIFFPDIPLKREINKTKEDNYCLFISDFHMDSDSFKKDSYDKYVSWLEKQKEKLTIFFVGDISTNIKDVEQLLSDTPERHKFHFIKGEADPPEVKSLPSPYSFQIDDVNIFLIHNQNIDFYKSLWGSMDKTLTTLLKKRHFDPLFTPEKTSNKKDVYILQKTPDIVVAAHSHIPSNTNYKGTTILSTGSFISQPIFWLINLRTREIFKQEFS